MNSSTPFPYDLRTRTYEQPEVAHQILRRFKQVNGPNLNIPIRFDYPFETRAVRKGESLTHLVNTGVEDPTIAATVLGAVMSELTMQKM